jgi:hypothetical protein
LAGFAQSVNLAAAEANVCPQHSDAHHPGPDPGSRHRAIDR